MATATDDVDPSPTVNCVPASGSVFAVGATTVVCRAVNAAGLPASGGSFTVTVIGPSQQTTNLGTLVNNLPTPPPGGSLDTKLQQILANINSGNISGACVNLAAFISEVQAQSGKKISPSDATALIQAAETIKAASGCP